MQEERRPDRRAPEPLLYDVDQLLGRAPIRLRRRSDKYRLAAHLGAATGLVLLTGWWLVPLHSFAGPVLVSLTPSHGVHAGDLPALLFLAGTLRSLVRSWRVVRPTHPATPA